MDVSTLTWSTRAPSRNRKKESIQNYDFLILNKRCLYPSSWTVQHQVSRKQDQRNFTIEIGDLFNTQLNFKFYSIYKSIEASRYILELEKGWDGEDTEGYKIETYISAVKFLIEYAKTIFDKYQIIIQTPSIVPSINGNIDLHWNFPTYDLLVSIPPPPDTIAHFYGDDYGDTKISGQLNLGKKIKLNIFLSLIGG